MLVSQGQCSLGSYILIFLHIFLYPGLVEINSCDGLGVTEAGYFGTFLFFIVSLFCLMSVQVEFYHVN